MKEQYYAFRNGLDVYRTNQ